MYRRGYTSCANESAEKACKANGYNSCAEQKAEEECKRAGYESCAARDQALELEREIAAERAKYDKQFPNDLLKFADEDTAKAKGLSAGRIAQLKANTDASMKAARDASDAK